MKKVGRCIECSREVYINEERFCKKCYRDAMLSGKIKANIPEKQEDSVILA
ncbi:hypothetical protein KY317_00085 [Candidatus Woesearchaeota archaeon]|nr:hypothetical protein [Candidatus Woesearchaeota archaeon]